MACLDENTVVRFMGGTLDAEAVERVDEHTATCDACRKLLAEYSATETAIMGSAAAVVAESEALRAAAIASQRDDEGGEPAPDISELAKRVALAQAKKRVGEVLAGKWTIERLVGMGGMAQVFAGTHRNGRKVAIKVMRPELAVEPRLVARFLREGYVANKVGHPDAVSVLDDDVTELGAPFLVMDLLSGRTLRERLDADGPLPAGEVLRIGKAVSDVLALAHENGIVHRDLKPDNLFETDAKVIKVLDFGIARLRERLSLETETQSGITMGTVGFMPPEQARGHASLVDARADVWAIGATMYNLLSGRTVHEAETQSEALLLAMTAKVANIATLLPELPLPLAELMDKALAFDRDARFANAGELRRALVAVTPAVLESTRPATPTSSAPRASAAPRDVVRSATSLSAPDARRIPAWLVVIGATFVLVALSAFAARGWPDAPSRAEIAAPVPAKASPSADGPQRVTWGELPAVSAADADVANGSLAADASTQVKPGPAARPAARRDDARDTRDPLAPRR